MISGDLQRIRVPSYRCTGEVFFLCFTAFLPGNEKITNSGFLMNHFVLAMPGEGSLGFPLTLPKFAV